MRTNIVIDDELKEKWWEIKREANHLNMKIGDYFAPMEKKIEFATFSFDDPLPFFAEIMMIPYLLRKKGF